MDKFILVMIRVMIASSNRHVPCCCMCLVMTIILLLSLLSPYSKRTQNMGHIKRLLGTRLLY